MTWHSTYLHSNETVVTQLQDALKAQHYTLYDPFARLTGTAYTEPVKLFVAPTQDDWTRVIGKIPPTVPEALSGVVFSVTLVDGVAQFRTWIDGEAAEPVDALAPYRRENGDLHDALTAPIDAGQSSPDSVPMDALPDDIRRQAAQLNPKQVDKLFGKLMKKVNRQVGDRNARSARALLGNRTDWNSPGGQRIRRVMACLTLPDDWHTPDFVTLRDAYQLHMRRKRNPDAVLYPGDAEAMSAVPDALDYTPVYGGR